jgi:hypothetical protein
LLIHVFCRARHFSTGSFLQNPKCIVANKSLHREIPAKAKPCLPQSRAGRGSDHLAGGGANFVPLVRAPGGDRAPYRAAGAMTRVVPPRDPVPTGAAARPPRYAPRITVSFTISWSDRVE